MKKFYGTTALLTLSLLLCACGQPTAEQSSDEQTPAQTTAAVSEAASTEPEVTTAAPLTDVPDGAYYVDFQSGVMPEGFETADGYSNGSMFNVTWRKKNVTFNDGKMQLVIDNDVAKLKGIPYSGGEFRSKDFFHYGRYEVSMKAIKNDGVVSSFFTYTGPSDNNPWDEIDVEILGKDTTKVQFNYFQDSKGSHEYMHDLGFDASEDFHTYAFEWHKTSIAWYVDGVEVHKVEKDEDKMPKTASKIMMNAWCGTGVDGWLNAFDDTNLPLTAEYEWLMYTPSEE